ncbi:hypothetical protein Tco_1358744 [Tanacetum coccineum]
MESTDLYSKADNKEKCAIWKNVAKQGTNQPKRTDAVASTESSGHIMFTSKQFKQLMRSLPHFGNHTEASNFAETEDELDNEYVAGYPQHQKGYKLYNLLTKTKFMSKDVQFHEDIFSYLQPHMLKLLNPIPSPSPQTTHWYEDYVSTAAPTVVTQDAPAAESANETASSTNL